MSALVGQFFHTFDDRGHIDRQGVVVAGVELGLYLVGFFNWIDGHESERRLVHVGSMSDWAFYGSVEDMKHAYNHRTSKAQ